MELSKEEVIRMAFEASPDMTWYAATEDPTQASIEELEFLERFAALAFAAGERANVVREPVAKVCHGLPSHIGWNPNAAVNEFPEGMPLYTHPISTKDLSDEDKDGLLFVLPVGTTFADIDAVIEIFKRKNK